MIGEEELLGLASLNGLELESKRIPNILDNLRRIEQLAQAVNDVELAAEDELAPVWRP